MVRRNRAWRMSEDGKLGNWIADLLFERRRSGEQGKTGGLLRSLFSAAVTGALVMLLADYVISSLVPEYWRPGYHWAVAAGGATGAVLQSLWNWFKYRHKSENSG